MTLNTSDEEIIAARRHKVARLRLKGATQREIAQAVQCSLGTVNGDLAALRQEWRDAAALDIADHQAQVLAELREVRRAAWAQPGNKGLPYVLQSLKQECALLGLDLQPGSMLPGDVEITLRWSDGRNIIDVTPADADRSTAAPQITDGRSDLPGALQGASSGAAMGQVTARLSVMSDDGAE